MPRMYDTDREQWFSSVVCELDLTSASAVIAVDGTDYATTWTTTAEQSDDLKTWSRTARTTNWFVGPAVTANPGDVVLALGNHDAELKVTVGGTTLTHKLPPIAVRS